MPLAVVGWNCQAFALDGSKERCEFCARQRYVPNDGITRFLSLDGCTVHFDGDIDLVLSFVTLVALEVPRLPARSWCNTANLCHNDAARMGAGRESNTQICSYFVAVRTWVLLGRHRGSSSTAASNL